MTSFWSVKLLLSLCILFVVDSRPQEKRRRGTLYDDAQRDYNSFQAHLYNRDYSLETKGTPNGPTLNQEVATNKGNAQADDWSLHKDDEDFEENVKDASAIPKVSTPNIKDATASIPISESVKAKSQVSETVSNVNVKTQQSGKMLDSEDIDMIVKPTQWSAQMQQYIDEVYGGQLPYADARETGSDDDDAVIVGKQSRLLPTTSQDNFQNANDASNDQQTHISDATSVKKQNDKSTSHDGKQSGNDELLKRNIGIQGHFITTPSVQDDNPTTRYAPRISLDDIPTTKYTPRISLDDVKSSSEGHISLDEVKSSSKDVDAVVPTQDDVIVDDVDVSSQEDEDNDDDYFDDEEYDDDDDDDGSDDESDDGDDDDDSEENDSTDDETTTIQNVIDLQDKKSQPQYDNTKPAAISKTNRDSLEELHAQMQKDGSSVSTKQDSLDKLHAQIDQDGLNPKVKKDGVDDLHIQMSKMINETDEHHAASPEYTEIKDNQQLGQSVINPTIDTVSARSKDGGNSKNIVRSLSMNGESKQGSFPHNVGIYKQAMSDKSNYGYLSDLNQKISKINNPQPTDDSAEVASIQKSEERKEKISDVVKMMDGKQPKQKYTLKNKNKFETKTVRVADDSKTRQNIKTTTASFSTQPNPPTTKPTKVTPNTGKGHKLQFIISKPYESCSDNGWCPPGRFCHQGTCVCGDDSFCAKHRKPVCGNDGVLYPSHCELHRTACVKRKHIRIDSQASCKTNEATTSGSPTPVTNGSTVSSTTAQPEVILGTQCEFSVRTATAGILWGQQVMTANVKSMDECRDLCEKADKGCVGFEYSDLEKYCGIFDNSDDVIFWPNKKMTYYEKKRCKELEPEIPDCGYETVQITADPLFAMCDLSVQLLPDFETCRKACVNCKAFTYQAHGSVCEIFYNDICVEMLNKQGTTHYVRHCHEDGQNCHILEVIPGRSPYMCSKATSSVANLIECHDTCIRGHCQAFRFRNDGSGFCEIFFDKSCITMLEKGKENYYVRRCANPEDCKYEEMESGGNAPCEILSRNTDTFEKCREACRTCVAFKYSYENGDCSLYQQSSCIAKKTMNYVKRDCHQLPEEAIATRSSSEVLHATPAPEHVVHMNAIQHQNVLDTSTTSHDEKATTVSPNNQVQESQNLDQIEIIEGGSKATMGGGSEVKKDGKNIPQNIAFGDDVMAGVRGDGVPEVPDVKDDGPPDSMYEKICTLQEYNRMKADILRYHCVKLGEAHCGEPTIPKKDYITTLMFSFYDRNMDDAIQKDELWEIWVMENFDRMFSSCTLMDLFKFENVDTANIYKSDFMDAFDIPASALKEEIQAVNTIATVGNGLEIRCGLQPTSPVSEIVWRRHGVDLMQVTFPGLAVFSDGTLYLESVDIHHIGNWTCHDRDKPGVKQVHVLQVHLPPVVSVAPSTQMFPEDKSDIYIHCHADGIPTPTLEWEVNGHSLPNEHNHFIKTHDNGTLIIYQSDYRTDTGAYKCTGRNVAGKSSQIATIFIQRPNQTDIVSSNKNRRESFFVFHKNGYTVYEPSGCFIERHVKENFGNLVHMPEDLNQAPSLCSGPSACQWGQSVNVNDKYIYVSQPQQGRIVVIDAENTMNPVEFIETDKFPAKLYYVAHLDEVWALCWNSNHNTGSKTIIVIQEASQNIRHHIVHTQPIGYRFDLVEDLFLPPSNTLTYKYNYGYVLHTEQRGLFKLELESMRYTKAVDLAAFDCVPQHVAFIPMGGHVIVDCLHRTSSNEHVTFQILLDYITDIPLANLTMYGTPYVTPDSRHVVTVNKKSGSLWVADVLEDGEIKKSFDVTVDASVSDITFLSSDQEAGYNAFLTSAETSEIYSVNLANGKVTTIKGVDTPHLSKLSPFSSVSRSIVSGDVFSDFVASPGKSSLIILNGKHKDIHCQFYNLLDPDAVIHSVASSR